MAVGPGTDHYSVLGVQRGAPPEEVKRAYRTLSKQYHPDKAGHLDEAHRRERERQMVALNVAYQVLSSPRSRQQYDLSAETPAQSSGAGSAGGGRWSSASTPRDRGPPPADAAGAGGGGGSWSRRMPSQGPHIPTPPGASVPPAKPRYTLGSRYTQSSRQARRMDPSQYTVHVDGRAAEFPTSGAAPAPQQRNVRSSSPGPAGGGPAVPPAAAPPAARNPTWLQRQIDIAKQWEEAHCPENVEEKYQWKKASHDVLKGVRERRQHRERSDADG